MILLAMLAAAVFALSPIMIVMYFNPAPEKRVKTTQRSTRHRWAALSKDTRQRLIFGGAVGVAAAIITGFPVMVVGVPAAFVALPLLLGKPSTRERDLLLALQTWARGMASTSETGVYTLKEVIGITRGSIPTILQAPVDRLYARMNSTWSARDALFAFAEEMDSAAADEVVTYLVQAADFNAGGLSRALNGVAETLSVAAKNALDTEAERAKPRDTMRAMAVIIGITIAGLVAFSGTELLAFYRTPGGTVVMVIILGMFVGLLAWAKHITRYVPDPRILTRLERTVDA